MLTDAVQPPETCEDRDYRCCDLTPPVVIDEDGIVRTELIDVEYFDWYDRHVAAWDRR